MSDGNQVGLVMVTEDMWRNISDHYFKYINLRMASLETKYNGIYVLFWGGRF